MNLLVGNNLVSQSEGRELLYGNSVLLIRSYNRYINQNKLEFSIKTDGETSGQLNIWFSKKKLKSLKVSEEYSNEYLGQNNVRYLNSVYFEPIDSFNIQIDLDTLEYCDLIINISDFSGNNVEFRPLQDDCEFRYAPRIREDNSSMFYSNYRDTFFLDIKANLDLDSSKYYIEKFVQYIVQWTQPNQSLNVVFFPFDEFNHYYVNPLRYSIIDRYSLLRKEILKNKNFVESNDDSMNEIVVVLTSRVKYTSSGVLQKDPIIETLSEVR